MVVNVRIYFCTLDSRRIFVPDKNRQMIELLSDLKDEVLIAIATKVEKGERITPEEGLYLYENGELAYLGVLANYVREKKHGNNTYFNKNFHLEPTNICLYTCSFCSYSRLIKKREELRFLRGSAGDLGLDLR
ncbi:MAG TPA: hypothetical protein PK147_07515, partial [Saprospiraceae bacterium]|nr:hypothetical protein [Saprospiraceae bacterium]